MYRNLCHLRILNFEGASFAVSKILNTPGRPNYCCGSGPQTVRFHFLVRPYIGGFVVKCAVLNKITTYVTTPIWAIMSTTSLDWVLHKTAWLSIRTPP